MKIPRAWNMLVAMTSLLMLVGCSSYETTTDETRPASDTAFTGTTDTTGGYPQSAGAAQPAAEDLIRAVADLRPTEGNVTRGTVTFTQVAGGVRVQADIVGLTPGKHGIHIHENGDCSAPDAASAGDHWNPSGAPHASPQEENRHMGDMGNIEADTTGMAFVEYVDRMITLEGPNSVVGKAVVVHAQEDDLMTQPSGNSGARIACGVIAEDNQGTMK